MNTHVNTAVETSRKIHHAKHLLDKGIEAYHGGDHIVAITLAGAAEEIFGAFCTRKDIRTALEDMILLPPLQTAFESDKARMKFLNDTRNNLKHAHDQNEDNYDFSEEYDSLYMLARALLNSHRADIEDSKIMREFRKTLKDKLIIFKE